MALRTPGTSKRVRSDSMRSERHMVTSPEKETDKGWSWGEILPKLKVRLLLLGPLGVGIWFIVKLLACYFLGICVL